MADIKPLYDPILGKMVMDQRSSITETTKVSGKFVGGGGGGGSGSLIPPVNLVTTEASIGGPVLTVHSDNSNFDTYTAHFISESNIFTHDTLRITANGGARGLFIKQLGEAAGLIIDALSRTYNLNDPRQTIFSIDGANTSFAMAKFVNHGVSVTNNANVFIQNTELGTLASTLTIRQAGDGRAIYIEQHDSTINPAIDIPAAKIGYRAVLNLDGGYGLFLNTAKAVSPSIGLATFQSTNVTDSNSLVKLSKAGPGYALEILQTGDNSAIYVNHSAASEAAIVTIGKLGFKTTVNTAGGFGLLVATDGTVATSPSIGLATFKDRYSLNTANLLNLDYAGKGNALYITHSDIGSSPTIDIDRNGNINSNTIIGQRIDVDNIGSGGAVGLDISNVTSLGGGAAIGIRLAAPSNGSTNYAFQLSDITGISAGGIWWGTDTNLYRSAADTLKTDDRLFIQDSNLTGNSLEIDRDGASDVADIIGLKIDVDNVGYSGGAVGIDVANITGNGANVGLRIAAPSGGSSNIALHLTDTNGIASGGITFGADVTLYRSAVDTLKTDDSLIVLGTITGSNLSGTNTGDQLIFKTIAVSGQSDIVADTTTDILTIVAGAGVTLTTNAGTDTLTIAASAKSLFDHYTDANNGTTLETDLYSDTLAASQFANNGDKVVSQYGGTFVGDATSTQRLKAYFGGTLIFDSGALGIGISIAYWDLVITCIRESASIVRCTVALNTSFATLNSYATYTKVTGLTLTNTQILKITGTAAGATGASNQITATEGFVEFKPAA